MKSIFLVVCLLGQIDVPPPPSPSPGETLQSPPSSGSSKEDLKIYLLSRLTIDLKFNVQQIEEVTKKLDTMDERQLRILANVYYERAQARQEYEKQRQRLVLGQEQLNLKRAEAYRDHLKREYQLSITQKEMENNLMRQAQIYQQQAINMTGFFNQFNRGYGYGGYRPYNGFGYNNGYRPYYGGRIYTIPTHVHRR